MSNTINLEEDINTPIPVIRKASGARRPTLDFPATWAAHVALKGRTPIVPLNFQDEKYRFSSEVEAWYNLGFTVAIYEGLLGLLISKGKLKNRKLSLRPSFDTSVYSSNRYSDYLPNFTPLNCDRVYTSFYEGVTSVDLIIKNLGEFNKLNEDLLSFSLVGMDYLKALQYFYTKIEAFQNGSLGYSPGGENITAFTAGFNFGVPFIASLKFSQNFQDAMWDRKLNLIYNNKKPVNSTVGSFTVGTKIFNLYSMPQVATPQAMVPPQATPAPQGPAAPTPTQDPTAMLQTTPSSPGITPSQVQVSKLQGKRVSTTPVLADLTEREKAYLQVIVDRAREPRTFVPIVSTDLMRAAGLKSSSREPYPTINALVAKGYIHYVKDSYQRFHYMYTLKALNVIKAPQGYSSNLNDPAHDTDMALLNAAFPTKGHTMSWEDLSKMFTPSMLENLLAKGMEAGFLKPTCGDALYASILNIKNDSDRYAMLLNVSYHRV